MSKKIFFPLFYFVSFSLFSQTVYFKEPFIKDFLRRNYISGNSTPSFFYSSSSDSSFNILLKDSKVILFLDLLSDDSSNRYKKELKLIPFNFSSQKVFGIPYPVGDKFVLGKGFQNFVSGGFFGRFGLLSIQLQPEFIYSQNKTFDSGKNKSKGIEYVELFGDRVYSKFLPGQSSIRLNYGAFSLGASTENIWWGPGQYNSLLFSNNAFGFQHLTLNTRKPAITFLGSFEGQLLMGKLDNFNSFFRNGKEDWRYVNGIIFSYQPKWIPGLFFGVSRVFQQYKSFNNQAFAYYFPIFEPFQKVNLIDPNSKVFDSTDYDDRLQSQQLTGFAKLVIPHAKAEVYFEFGRRDHAVNWREFLLNPEHARAYLLGFKKLIPLRNKAFFQINGEILQQQESINILTRYGPSGGSSWASHGIQQGFTHQGQMLGPGVGPSSNVQTLETSWVKGIKKLGIRWERLNRHQDFFTRVFNDPSENGRWVDYSSQILFDWQNDKLILSSSLNLVYSVNKQWELTEISTKEFPKGKNKFSFIPQINLFFPLWN